MYRSYKGMTQVVQKHHKSVLCGNMIDCKAANDGELEYGNILHSMMRSIQYASGLCVEKVYIHDAFIPEQHGIVQQSNQTPKNANESERAPRKKKDVFKNLSQYYNTTTSTRSYKTSSHVLNEIIFLYPIRTPILFYIVMKPWSKIDADYNKVREYWSINYSHAMILNYLFHRSPIVYFIFKITHKVSWESRRIAKSTEIGYYKNPWNKDTAIAGLKDCTVLEPELGRKIVNEIIRY